MGLFIATLAHYHSLNMTRVSEPKIGPVQVFFITFHIHAQLFWPATKAESENHSRARLQGQDSYHDWSRLELSHEASPIIDLKEASPLGAVGQVDAGQRSDCPDGSLDEDGRVGLRVGPVQCRRPRTSDGHRFVLAAKANQELENLGRVLEVVTTLRTSTFTSTFVFKRQEKSSTFERHVII